MNQPLHMPLDDDARFDAQLRQAFALDPQPANGEAFAARLMDTLPRQRRPAPVGSPWPARLAIGMAMGLGSALLAALPTQGLSGLEQSLATACLLIMLLWWSLPQSRGSLWH